MKAWPRLMLGRPLSRWTRRSLYRNSSSFQTKNNIPSPWYRTASLLGIGAALGGVMVSVFRSPQLPSSSDAEQSPPRWRDSQTETAPRSLKYATRDNMLAAVEEIRVAIGQDKVSVDEDDIEDHGHKDWSTSNTRIRSVAIVRPISTQQVSTVASICSKHLVPMVPYGAGSSVEGNFSSPYSGICIDLSDMNKIVAFYPDDMNVVVQPGVNWIDLNKQIEGSQLFLPLDPGPTALIGGMVSTNCSGTNATRYGTMRDYVVNLTVVLADGSVIKTRHRPRKTSAGYNLNALFTGSEGTLGIITEVTLRLAVVPDMFSVATASFRTVRDAADAVTKMMRGGLPLAAIELMDESQMRIINKNGGAGGQMWEEIPTLFLKFSGNERSVQDDILSASEFVQSSGCITFQQATTEAEKESLWSARKLALWSSLAVRPDGTVMWSTDVAVPLSKLADLISLSQQKAAKLDLFNSVLGHVGDGNFHQLFFYDPNKEGDQQAVSELVDSQIKKAIELEGTVSGEHGIGLGKKDCLLEELGPSTIGVMKALKDTLDPHWLLNPGKVFDDVPV